MTPTAAKPLPPSVAWIMILVGSLLILAAIGLAILVYVFLPAPSRLFFGRLTGWRPVLPVVLALMGAAGFVNGLHTRRTGRENLALRALTLICSAAIISICLAFIFSPLLQLN